LIKIKIKKPLYGVVENMLLDVDLEIKKGEFVAIKGKSGSGKTTFLRILAGLEDAEGEIEVNGEIWLNNKINLAPQKREIGFLFQDYALFENMSVEENLLFVRDDKNLANRLLEITELSSLKNRYPKTLSGGQKQRVSLCRALMKRPQILLLDEPLSALDLEMRINLQNEILKLHKEFNLTTIMISHDLSEIYKLISPSRINACASSIFLFTDESVSLRIRPSSINNFNFVFISSKALGSNSNADIFPSISESLSSFSFSFALACSRCFS
jgi:molybdate transport system ATP-binding protein